MDEIGNSSEVSTGTSEVSEASTATNDISIEESGEASVDEFEADESEINSEPENMDEEASFEDFENTNFENYDFDGEAVDEASVEDFENAGMEDISAQVEDNPENTSDENVIAEGNGDSLTDGYNNDNAIESELSGDNDIVDENVVDNDTIESVGTTEGKADEASDIGTEPDSYDYDTQETQETNPKIDDEETSQIEEMPADESERVIEDEENVLTDENNNDNLVESELSDDNDIVDENVVDDDTIESVEMNEGKDDEASDIGTEPDSYDYDAQETQETNPRIDNEETGQIEEMPTDESEKTIEEEEDVLTDKNNNDNSVESELSDDNDITNENVVDDETIESGEATEGKVDDASDIGTEPDSNDYEAQDTQDTNPKIDDEKTSQIDEMTADESEKVIEQEEDVLTDENNNDNLVESELSDDSDIVDENVVDDETIKSVESTEGKADEVYDVNSELDSNVMGSTDVHDIDPSIDEGANKIQEGPVDGNLIQEVSGYALTDEITNMDTYDAEYLETENIDTINPSIGTSAEGRGPLDDPSSPGGLEVQEDLDSPPEVHENPTENWEQIKTRTFITNDGEEISYDEAVSRMNGKIEEQLTNMNVSKEERDVILNDVEDTLINLQIETDSRGIGEHGIKHMYGNLERSIDMYDKYVKSNEKYEATDQERLGVMIAQIYHDIGYLKLNDGAKFNRGQDKTHDEKSGEFFKDKEYLYKDILGTECLERAELAINTHNTDVDENIKKNCNFENDPLIASVHMSDKLALGEREKLAELMENDKVRSVVQGMYYVKHFETGMTQKEIDEYTGRLEEKLNNIIESEEGFKYIDEDLKKQFKIAVNKDVGLDSSKFGTPMSVVDTGPKCTSFEDSKTVITIGVLKNNETTDSKRLEYAQALEDEGIYRRQIDKLMEDLAISKKEWDDAITELKMERPSNMTDEEYSKFLKNVIPKEIEIKGRNIKFKFPEMELAEKDKRLDILKTQKEAAEEWEKVGFVEKRNETMEKYKAEIDRKIKEKTVSAEDVEQLVNALKTTINDADEVDRVNKMITEFYLDNDNHKKKDVAENYAKKFLNYVKFDSRYKEYMEGVLNK